MYQPQHGGRHNRHAIKGVHRIGVRDAQLTTALAEGCAVIDDVGPIRGADTAHNQQPGQNGPRLASMQPANRLVAQEAICTNVEPWSNLNSLIYLGCRSRALLAASDQSERHVELGFSVKGPLLRGKWLTAGFAKRKSASSTAMNTGQRWLIIVIPVSEM